jgi:hypothetical protein
MLFWPTRAKIEFASDEFAIENNRRSSEGTGTKRKNICSRQAIAKALGVALKSFDLPEHVMGERDRLGALQMGVARHHDIEMLFGEIEQCRLERAKPSASIG